MTWTVIGISMFAVMGATVVFGGAVALGFMLGVGFVIATVEAEEGTFS